jgi:hypothetical protein
VLFCDEFEGGFGWIADEFVERCSHAFVADSRVWLIDALDGDGVQERVRAAGEPAGVIQLLDRHNRDCAELATKLGVPHHMVPQQPLGMSRNWKEVALWWPERRVLACGDVLGSARYYRAGDERIAVHPFLRLRPPRGTFAQLQPAAILCGHGPGVFEDADAALREAFRTARRRIPAQLASAVRAWRANRPS